ncbi:MAG: septal ring lytic transglycosylase RlpA family protein [Methylotenera sp.]
MINKPIITPRIVAVKKYAVLLSVILLAACAGQTAIKKTPPSPQTSTPQAPATQVPTTQSAADNASAKTETKSEAKPGAGGYYLDDGPGENAPANIDSIPSAPLKTEQPNKRANRPYIALGQQYTPMKSYAPYKKQGIASWYGKRFHGKKTSTGEIYDMYAMSAAHTVLPIPSYAKVTNPANGRFVIVRVNDRGPFKSDRLIDLSYAAAYQLRLIKQGKGLVEVETIDTSAEAIRSPSNKPLAQTAAIPENSSPTTATTTPIVSETASTTPTASATAAQFYVQAGAFKYEANGEVLQKKIQGLEFAENVGIANVYNNGLYRVKLGPYASRKDADILAAKIRGQLNIAAHIVQQ